METSVKKKSIPKTEVQTVHTLTTNNTTGIHHFVCVWGGLFLLFLSLSTGVKDSLLREGSPYQDVSSTKKKKKKKFTTTPEEGFTRCGPNAEGK